MRVAFTKKSSNAKVGPIPVTTSERDSCPPTCPFLKNGCYADSGMYTRLHWDKISAGERGDTLEALHKQVRKLPEGQLWRHNVAGDLKHTDGAIDAPALWQLVAANTGRRGFTYTHHVPEGDNLDAIEGANRAGFTVNISCNSPAEAVVMQSRTTAPVVTTVAPEFWAEGDKVGPVVRCPAETRDDVSCATCQLCQRAERKVIVGFTAHGSQSAKVLDVIARAA